MGKRIAQLAFILAAVALTIWGVATVLHPVTECRGVEMRPGDVCRKSTLTDLETDTMQSYEARIATVKQQMPYVIGAGVLATVFGVVIMVRSGRERHRAVDDPVLIHEDDLHDPKS